LKGNVKETKAAMNLMRRAFIFLLTTFATFFVASPSSARAASVAIPHGTVELIAENQGIRPGQPFYVGLHFQLEKGWHIYWINPGDSGQPPTVKWSLPAGLTAGPMEWPTPERMQASSTIVDYGYHDAVLLMVPMRTGAGLATAYPARVGAEVEMLVCREMCIPGKTQLSLTLPIMQAAEANSGARELFAATRKSLPKPAPSSWEFRLSDAKDSFVLTARVARPIMQATFFPVAESQIDNVAPQKLTTIPAGFQLTMQKSDQLSKPIARLKGVLVLSPSEAYSIDAPLVKALRRTTAPKLNSTQ
jgi:DsbC/DsbD-like thiol-disulfide interchange protein